MMRLLQPFLLLLARATDKELARMVEFLKEENRILRDKLPKTIQVTPQERQRLLKLGRKLGAAVKDLITIVSPRTFARWLAGDKPKAKPRGKPGRPRTADDIKTLILRLARETGWGYTRILGELKKLGINSVSRSTVVNILKEAGLDPGPKRGRGSWDEFIKQHAATLWAADFFSRKVVTTSGLVDMYVLFFLHVGSRRVQVAGVAAHPDRAWVTQQARNFAMANSSLPDRPRFLLIDHDTKFVPGFDAVFEDEGVEVKRMGPLAPNLNAYAERFVQSVEQECLDHFVVFGETHLRHVVAEYATHYNRERPHQAVGNRPLGGPEAVPPLPSPNGEVVCDERLGGLLRHYRRAG